MVLDILTILVRHLKTQLTREQRKFFMCDYSEIDKIPKEIRDFIIDVALQENSPQKLLYIDCGITNIDDMVDNIIRYLYLIINFSQKEFY